MKQISKEQFLHDCEMFSQWVNEGHFVTVFEAKLKNGFCNDTHYCEVVLISTDKGLWNVTKFVAELVCLRCSEVYGINGTLLWHGSIYNLMHNILCKLNELGYTINVKTDDESAVNRTFRLV